MTWAEEAADRAGMLRALAHVQAMIDQGSTLDHIRLWCNTAISEAVESLRAPSSGPATSAAAAATMETRKGSLRHKALLAYRHADHTDEEVGNIIGHPRIWPRCSELRSMGLIEDTGEVRLVARTGQDAAVHRITAAGLAVLQSIED